MTINKYVFDTTGVNVNNLITGEIHYIPRQRNHAVVLKAGIFYTDSVVVTHLESGNELVLDVDYRILSLNEEVVQITNKSACGFLYFMVPDFYGTVSVTYQAVGGRFESHINTIQQELATLKVADGTVSFYDIIDRPVRFPPSPHLHTVNDLYGFEDLIDAVDNLSTVVSNSDNSALSQFSMQQLATTNAINNVMGLLNDPDGVQERLLGLTNKTTALELALTNAMDGLDSDSIAEAAGVAQNLTDHMSTPNAHGVTAETLNLGNVENLPVATESEALTGSSNFVYMTPLRTTETVNSILGSQIESLVTPFVPVEATEEQTTAGTDNTTIVTPRRLEARLDVRFAEAVSSFSSSIPVESTQAEVDSGVDTTSFITPRRLNEKLQSTVGVEVLQTSVDESVDISDLGHLTIRRVVELISNLTLSTKGLVSSEDGTYLLSLTDSAANNALPGNMDIGGVELARKGFFVFNDDSLGNTPTLIGDALSGLLALRPMSLSPNSAGITVGMESGKQWDFIDPTEITSEFPHLANTHASGTKTVNMAGLLPSVVRGVQQISDNINNLTTRITNAEAAIATLESAPDSTPPVTFLPRRIVFGTTVARDTTNVSKLRIYVANDGYIKFKLHDPIANIVMAYQEYKFADNFPLGTDGLYETRFVDFELDEGGAIGEWDDIVGDDDGAYWLGDLQPVSTLGAGAGLEIRLKSDHSVYAYFEVDISVSNYQIN